MSSVDLPSVATMLNVPYAGPALAINKFEIDSRRIESGDVFIAVPGARVDGHDYVDAAVERGAIAALVERPVEAAIPVLEVADCIEALSAIGRENRRAFSGIVVAITGSCGKTSVKNMCRAVFSEAGETLATPGNYNNEIGVPLTLTRISDSTQFAIIEMGAAGSGHIAHLCSLAKPDLSTVLNAMEAHLDGFGSVAQVADMKAEIFDALGANDTAILNIDQPWAELWRKRIEASGAALMTYSLSGHADLWIDGLAEQGLNGSVLQLHTREEAQRVHLPQPGLHSVANALAASALAAAAGLSLDQIVAGLERAESESGRLQTRRLQNGATVIDDTYNANPGSVRAAIDLLAKIPGKNLLILGEMLELGVESAPLHREMGQRARDRGLAGFVGVGAALEDAVRAFGQTGAWFADKAAARAGAGLGD
ncbi:MAG: UDP-N-acetylmuramoyl-tripeptide--D-alanyl-D-alanine ligase [Congregibacter sp.]